MRLAAIDIGSNAVRLQINRILFSEEEQPVYKNLEYIRFPLRLGTDVFKTGELTFRTEAKFIDLIKAFRTLIDLYDVDDLFASATSAMRDAANGRRILKRAYEKSGIKIELIDGDKEADLINLAVSKAVEHDDYLSIDVGGGSTEISVVKDRQIQNRRSFRLGSVRNMQRRESTDEWSQMDNWVAQHAKGVQMNAVGTGGNIRSIMKFIKNGQKDQATREGLDQANEYVRGFSIEDRVQKLQLREDRADVINYAIDIYLRIMQIADCPEIMIPNVGLKDGIIEMLFERNL